MSGQVSISVCIPAYKNTAYLGRLLDSCSIQGFRDFEVVVTDDSPDDSISSYLESYKADFPLRYIRNAKSLGTPGNWNEGIRQARGRWIKLMHDDDWFSGPDALETFHRATLEHPEVRFFFSAFTNVDEDTGRLESVTCTGFDLWLLRRSPLVLFKRVYVGNPSCTLVLREAGLLYDEEFKWVVDFEYYLRFFQRHGGFHYIGRNLLNIGFNAQQVTKYTSRVREVQIPEYLSLLQKMGPSILRNPFVYDCYWRLMRNLGIREVREVESLWAGPVPKPIRRMIAFQRRIPLSVLRFGALSKAFMSMSYIAGLSSGDG